MRRHKCPWCTPNKGARLNKRNSIYFLYLKIDYVIDLKEKELQTCKYIERIYSEDIDIARE